MAARIDSFSGVVVLLSLTSSNEIAKKFSPAARTLPNSSAPSGIVGSPRKISAWTARALTTSPTLAFLA
jgi:hypothetical protein